MAMHMHMHDHGRGGELERVRHHNSRGCQRIGFCSTASLEMSHRPSPRLAAEARCGIARQGVRK